MKNVLIMILIPFLFGCILFCSPPKEEKSVLRTLASWDMPPAYNGNPFSPGDPGGVGDVKFYIYGPFFGYDIFKGEYWPWIGLEYEETEKTLTVKLRRDIRWEDGTPFTSKDVYTSFVLHGARGEWSEVWKYIDKMEIPDSFTVVFHYSSIRPVITKYYALADNLIDACYHIYGKWLDEAEELLKLRKDIWHKEKLGENVKELNAQMESENYKFRESLYKFRPQKPTGYGPFKVKTVTSDEIVAEKSNTFWAAKEILFDEIRLGRYTTNELVWASLIAGELDIEKPITPIDVVEAILNKQPKIRHVPVTDFALVCLAINNVRFPFTEKNFRKALAYIIDRDKVRMVALYFGTTVKYPCGLLPSVLENWTTPELRNILNQYQLDYSKAEELLKKIGLVKNSSEYWTTKDGKELKFEIATNPNSDWVLAAEEISRQLTTFGLKTNVRIIEGSLYGPTLSKKDYDMAMEQVVAKVHPVQGYQNFYKSGGWIKLRGWIAYITGFIPKVIGPDGRELDLNKLQQELFVTFDPVQQREIIEQLAWASNEYLPAIDLLEKNSQLFICDGVRVAGWPNGDELLNKLGYNWRIASLTWMIDGTLKPGSVRIK